MILYCKSNITVHSYTYAHSCIICHNTDFVNIIAESRLCDLYDPRKFMCATEISSL